MRELIGQFGFWAALDVLIIAFIIYNLLILLRGTRAMQMVTGIIIIVGTIFVFSQLYPLNTLKWMMNKFYSSLIIILFILFQDEIKRVLSGVGKKSFLPGSETVSSKALLDEITRAASALSTKKIGALITIERNIILTKYVDVGILIDGRVSKELLLSIFHPTSPIHDGSVIIQQGRVSAAGCFLPLTRDENIDPNMGTRHRAAIGITQETDAIVVLVSEEAASISLVVDGIVSRGMAPKELRKLLRNLLSRTAREEEKRSKIKKVATSSTWEWINRIKLYRENLKK
jgi:diadenylate cyclase